MSSLVIPQSPGSGSDSDGDEDSYLGLVLDRNANASTASLASLEPLDRLDALQRANTELGKKLMEAERTLQAKLFEHEAELEDMQGRLEEVKSELSATKREEKELRSKEVGFCLSAILFPFQVFICVPNTDYMRIYSDKT